MNDDAKLTVGLHREVVKRLESLATVGIFGVSSSEVAERLICEGLVRLIEKGWAGGLPGRIR